MGTPIAPLGDDARWCGYQEFLTSAPHPHLGLEDTSNHYRRVAQVKKRLVSVGDTLGASRSRTNTLLLPPAVAKSNADHARDQGKPQARCRRPRQWPLSRQRARPDPGNPIKAPRRRTEEGGSARCRPLQQIGFRTRALTAPPDAHTNRSGMAGFGMPSEVKIGRKRLSNCFLKN